MQCPTRKQCRTKRCWRPSQWSAWSPSGADYFQCKVCDGELEDWWEQHNQPCELRQRPHQRPRNFVLRPFPKFKTDVPEEASRLQELVAHMDTQAFGELVECWMSLPKYLRKLLSYNGVVLSGPGDLVHYHCPHTCQDYFDPTNMIYI